MSEDSLADGHRNVRIRRIRHRRLRDTLNIRGADQLRVDAIGLEQLQRLLQCRLHLRRRHSRR